MTRPRSAADLAGYGRSYAEEIHQHLKAAVRGRDLGAVATIARLGVLLLPRWTDRGRAVLPARFTKRLGRSGRGQPRR